ncbi:hypothetical protein CHUAL_003502 [Chamberlinius hualienensis]
MSSDTTSNCSCPCDRNPQPKPSTSSNNNDKFNPALSDNPSEWTPYVPPHFGPEKILYCRTQYNLAIDKDGKVFGTPEPYHSESILFFTSDKVGEVKMKGVASGKYLAMNRRGNLYGEDDPNSDRTVFIEIFDQKTGYNNYLSRNYSHLGWYVGIKKSGKPKPGPKTAFGQKAIMFLPRQARPSGTE